MPKTKKKKLYRYVKNDDTEQAIKLLEDPNINLEAQGSNNMTALLWASARGNDRLVGLLLGHKADINATNVEKWTCLLCAALIANVRCVEILIENKCDVNAADNDEKTALMCACVNACAVRDPESKAQFQQKTADCITALLDAGANIDAKDHNKMTALMWASAKNNAKGVEVLLENKPDLEVKNDDSLTSLAWACQQGNCDIAKMLIDAGAAMDTQDADGWTPLMWASKKIETAQAPADMEGESKESFDALERENVIISQQGALRCIEYLIQAEANIDQKDDAGKTALMWAVESMNFPAVKLLLQHNADVHHHDLLGNSATFMASPDGGSPSIDMAQLLNEHIANESVCKPCSCTIA